MTTVGDVQNLPRWHRLLLLLSGFFGLFAALCTVFALVVTVAEGWIERTQSQWPEATAQVQRCGVEIYTHSPDAYWIDCSVRYEVRGEAVIAHLHSRTTPAPQRLLWRYPDPAYQIERLQDWVDAHPEGTPIAVHYDPANHKKAVLVTTDMPLGGPRTPNNLKILEVAAVSCVVLLTIARIARPRSAP